MYKSLSPRLKTILELVVQDYIKTAEPVGSEALVSRHQLTLSSATIRKVMAELEEMGFLTHPHTSAGRIPTEEGLRTYVSEILAVEELSGEMRAMIERQLSGSQNNPSSILSVCSKVLSNITRHMGVVIAPAMERLPLKQIYFVRLSNKEVLAVISGENGFIHNKVLRTVEDYTQDELNMVNSYLSEISLGLTLSEVKDRILSSMGEEKKAFDILYTRALELSSQVLAQQGDEGDLPLYMDGQGNLLDYPEFAETEAMKALFKTFEDKRRILDLLNEVADSGQVRIVIGQQAASAALDGLALVASPYNKGDLSVGAIGIIGPQRLNYSKIVPVVDYAAQVLSELMDD